jgi:phage terminase large subunit GpA-like protein
VTIAGVIPRQTAPEAVARWREMRKKICSISFAPKSLLTHSQWSDKYRYLSSDLGEPGRWKTSRVPYLRGPMDAITDPRVRRVTVMKSARIGATQAIVVNTIGYCIHQEPTSIIVGVPTIGDAQKFSKSILDPMLDVTPVVRDRIDGGTMLEKTYPGGQLHIVGTQSPRALRMVHGRYILKSEIDAWEGSSGDDGDPYNLIDKRAGAYSSPKIVEESTPLIAETSRIEPAFKAGSMEFFFVPCPKCGEMQRLVWGGKDVNFGIKWERNADGSPTLSSVEYLCINGCHIPETRKHAMVRDGANEPRNGWRANFPERREHRSFHLNALVSPFDGARWSLLVDEWYKTERKPEKVRVFVNTFLGETYVEAGKQADANSLMRRRDESTWWSAETPVPEGVAVLTCSCDIQDDRIERAVFGWGAGEECWIIDWEIIPGDPATPEPWKELDDRLAKSYRHVSGRRLIPRVTFIDSGGHHSKQVNTYCRNRQHRHVYSIFGATLERAPILGRMSRNNAAKTMQFPIGVFAAKEALISRLDRILTPGPGFINIPSWLEDEQIEQLTAEKLVRRGLKRLFAKMRERNEMTDLWVYAFAGLHKLGPKTLNRLGKLAKSLMTKSTPQLDDPDLLESAGVDTPGDASYEPPSEARQEAKREVQRQAKRRRRPGGGGFVGGWQ